MIKPRIEELLQRQLDGNLQESEAAELREVLMADNAARVEQMSLERVHTALMDVPAEAPAPGFADSVERAIATVAAPTRQAETDHLTHSNTGRWRPSPREFIAFAAGIGLMLILRVPTLQTPRIDGDQATGTLIASSAGPTDQQTLTIEGLTLRAVIARSDAHLEIEISGDAQQTAGIELGFDDSQWSISGFDGAEAPHTNLAMGAGYLRWQQESAFRCVLTMRQISETSTHTPLRIDATVNGEVHSLDLDTATGGRR